MTWLFCSRNHADWDTCRWEKLHAREGLEKDAFEKATWGFLELVLGRNYNMDFSVSKAREYRWTGDLVLTSSAGRSTMGVRSSNVLTSWNRRRSCLL